MASVISLAVHLIKVLIGQIAQPRHKGIAQQITQSKDVFREAVRTRVVLPQSQDRVVFQKAIERISASCGEQDIIRVPNTEYWSDVWVYTVTAHS